jgi:hypothetical protein
MGHFMLSMYQPDGGQPPPEFLEKVMSDLAVFNKQIADAGGWVYTGSLQEAGRATVFRLAGDEVISTEGPYSAGTEHLGGFWIVSAPDLDTALGWGRQATMLTGLPTEVRAFRDEAESSEGNQGSDGSEG